MVEVGSSEVLKHKVYTFLSGVIVVVIVVVSVVVVVVLFKREFMNFT